MTTGRILGAFALALVLALPTVDALAGEGKAKEGRVEPILGEDGIYRQAWFVESFLDLKEDLAEAQGAGKRMAIFWEQRGCPYCKETHTVNLASPTINSYVRDNFHVVQLNLWGDREVTDFDGAVLSEKELAQKWGVVFTPTIHFLVEQQELKDNQPGSKQIAAVMPGYFRPFHFLRMFEYVKNRIYDRTHFQRYISERAEEFRKAGKSFEIW